MRLGRHREIVEIMNAWFFTIHSIPSGFLPGCRSSGHSEPIESQSSCLRTCRGPSARTCHNSRLLAYNFITQIASNGNLQIKMHCFTSQHLSQR